MCWVKNPTIVGNLYPSVAWWRLQGPGQHSTQAGQARGLRKLKLFCVESLTWKTLSSLQTVQARTIMTSVCEQRTNTRQHNLHLILCVRGSLRCQQGYNTAAALTTEYCIVTRDTWHVTRDICSGDLSPLRRDPLPRVLHVLCVLASWLLAMRALPRTLPYQLISSHGKSRELPYQLISSHCKTLIS